MNLVAVMHLGSERARLGVRGAEWRRDGVKPSHVQECDQMAVINSCYLNGAGPRRK